MVLPGPGINFVRSDHRGVWMKLLKDVMNDGKMTDVSILCEDRILKAHKLVLSSNSVFFEKLFTEYQLPSPPFIVIMNVKYDILKKIIDFIYVGETKIQTNELNDFVKAAELLKVNGLMKGGREALSNIEKSKTCPAANEPPLSTEPSRSGLNEIATSSQVLVPDPAHSVELACGRIINFPQMRNMIPIDGTVGVSETSTTCGERPTDDQPFDDQENGQNPTPLPRPLPSTSFGEPIERKSIKNEKIESEPKKSIPVLRERPKRTAMRLSKATQNEREPDKSIAIAQTSTFGHQNSGPTTREARKPIPSGSCGRDDQNKYSVDLCDGIAIKVEPESDSDDVDTNNESNNSLVPVEAKTEKEESEDDDDKGSCIVPSNVVPYQSGVNKRPSRTKKRPAKLDEYLYPNEENGGDSRQTPAKIPRPPNAFMIFANEQRKKLSARYPGESNKEISVRLGGMWNRLSKAKQELYYNASKVASETHKEQYPDYHYSPKEARLEKLKRTKTAVKPVHVEDSEVDLSSLPPLPVLFHESGTTYQEQTEKK